MNEITDITFSALLANASGHVILHLTIEEAIILRFILSQLLNCNNVSDLY